MNEPDDHDHAADFVDAMRNAYRQDAPIQEFRNLIEDAPVVPIAMYYVLADSFVNYRRLDVLRLLLELEPQIVKHKNDGSLLLHSAIRSEAHFEAIQLILDANPEGVFEKSTYLDGRTPLHLACEHYAESSAETVELLLSRYPGAASISGGPRDNLPILVALAFEVDERAVSALLDAFPGAASVQGSNELARDSDVLPLHLAYQNYYSMELVRRLVAIYPQGPSSRDSGGNLPLHRFCKRQDLTRDAFNFLLDKHPDGISTRNDIGELPLHCALDRRVHMPPLPLEIIQYLISLYPQAVNATDDRGNLPLHTACCVGASPDVVQLLLDRYTGDERNHCGLNVANNAGWLPLHCYTIIHGTDTNVVQHLLDLYPQGIRVADRAGMLPLHMACGTFHPSLDIIRLLVETDQYTIVVNCQHGTPYQIACSLEHRNVDVEAYLFEKQNEAVAALKEACESLGATQLGLPDLVVALVWSFAHPDLWAPDN